MTDTAKQQLVPKLRFPEFKEEWEVASISEKLSRVIDYRGKAPPKADSGVPLITARNVRDGYLDFAADEYIDEEQYDAWMRRGIPKANDVLFTTEAPLGNVALFPSSGRYALGQRIITLQADSARCYSVFLFHILRTDAVRKAIDEKSTGSTAKGIKSKVFVQIPLASPKTAEQQKIADFLTAVDKRIQQLSQKKALLEGYKKGVMQQLYTQTLRFREDNGNEFPDWEEKTLGDVVTLNPKTFDLPDSFTYIDLESVNAGVLHSPRRIAKVDAPSRAQRLLQRGDILYQTVRPYQMNNYLFELEGVYVASTGYAQLRATENDCHFIYQWLHLPSFVGDVMDRCTGTSFPAINSKDLAEIVISIPSVPEQTKIANFLSGIDRKIEAVAALLAFTQTWKKGLSQQMFV